MNGKGGTHMAVMTFAAIDIGSYEVSMKIFEMSKRIGFRELNDSDTVWKSERVSILTERSIQKC